MNIVSRSLQEAPRTASAVGDNAAEPAEPGVFEGALDEQLSPEVTEEDTGSAAAPREVAEKVAPREQLAAALAELAGEAGNEIPIEARVPTESGDARSDALPATPGDREPASVPGLPRVVAAPAPNGSEPAVAPSVDEPTVSAVSVLPVLNATSGEPVEAVVRDAEQQVLQSPPDGATQQRASMETDAPREDRTGPVAAFANARTDASAAMASPAEPDARNDDARSNDDPRASEDARHNDDARPGDDPRRNSDARLTDDSRRNDDPRRAAETPRETPPPSEPSRDLAALTPGARPESGGEAPTLPRVSADDVPPPRAVDAPVAPREAAPAPAPSTPASSGTPAEAIPFQAEWLAARGGGSARLTLNPPELGHVQLTVTVRGNSVDVVVAASEPAAQALALEARAQLGDQLSSREMRMENFEVRSLGRAEDTGREDADRQPRDAQAESGDAGGSRQEGGRFEGTLTALNGESDGAPYASPPPTFTKGGVDLHV